MSVATRPSLLSLGFDREKVRWEDHFFDLTPVEKIGGLYWKREDKFAPLGYGGINGSKLRQCCWLVKGYVDSRFNKGRAVGIVSGASVKSPQISMGTAVAKYFGLESVMVIGATNPTSALKHENVAVAAWLGAKFVINPVAYNPALQDRVRALQASDERLKHHYLLNYGITIPKDASDEVIEAFHFLGSHQVENIPDDVHTLVIPAGSCNSAVSIMYGLARFRPRGLRRVVLFGIGPNRLDFILDRIQAIERVTGLLIARMFRPDFIHNREKEPGWPKRVTRDVHEFTLTHFDLHGSGYASYQDEMPEFHEGIELHPTYEGKVWRYMMEHRTDLRRILGDDRFPDEGTLYWIVGSKPRRENMFLALSGRYGDPYGPKRLEMF